MKPRKPQPRSETGPTILLQTEHANDADPGDLVGPRHVDTHHIRGEAFLEYEHPEVAPRRLYLKSTGNLLFTEGIVAKIYGKRYRVHYSGQNDEATGEPKSGTIALTPTDDPETPYQVPPPGSEWTTPIMFFGQPVFRQQKRFPHLENQCACLLFTAHTGWADSGVFNIFLNFDHTGAPNRAWLEASCS